MNYKIFLLIIALIKFSNNSKAQIYDLEKNKILYQAHLNSFYKKIRENKTEIKVLHLGDSHIMIGHFSNEIRRLFDSAIGIKSYGWVFPNQIGRFNTFKTIKGKTGFINNLQKESKYLNGITGQSIQFLDAKTEIEFSMKNLPDSLMYFNKLKILYQTDTTANILLTVSDSINKSVVRSDTYTNSSAITNYFPENQRISEYNLNKYNNKLKLHVEKSDSTKEFNLLGFYIENSNKSGMIYNSLGVGGSSLYSITNNNSLLVGNINMYKPDLIILSFGSNDAYNKSFDSVKYRSKLENFIDSIVSRSKFFCC